MKRFQLLELLKFKICFMRHAHFICSQFCDKINPLVCRYALNSKPGKENTKERGELEVRIGFIVKAGSLTDLSKKERHKSSLGQLSSAAQTIGGSLLSIGSLEKRKGLKKLAKSIGNKVKGKSKNRLDGNNLNEKEEREIKITRQEPGEADPGVISEDEDEFTVSKSKLHIYTSGIVNEE